MATADPLFDAILDTIDPVQDEPEPEEVLPEETEETEEHEETEELPESQEDTQETVETAEAQNEDALDLSELSQYLGIDASNLDVNDDGKLLIKTRSDGKDKFAPIDELVSSYQMIGHINNQNMEVAELRKQYQQKISTLDDGYQSKVKEAEDLAAIAMGVLNADFNTVNWNELKQDDPTEYVLKKQEFEERQRQIAQAYQQIQSKRTEAPTVDTAAEKEKLLSFVPEWADQSVVDKDWSIMVNYATNIGYSADELGKINDHKLMVILRDAAKFANLNKEKPIVTKRVRKAPKIAKPGTGATSVPTDKLAKLRADVRKQDGNNGSFERYLIESGIAN